MYYVYTLFSKRYHELYKGFTNDLDKRWKEHKKGLVASTRDKRPLDLIFYEAYKNKEDALNREKYFKTGWGRNYLRNILKNYLKENN